MVKYPVLVPDANGIFKLYEDYEIKGYKIPKNFTTDGLTLKTRLLRLVVDKYQPKFAPFFVLHDWLCFLERYKEADEVGAEVLFEIENSWRTRAMIKAVMLYHRLKYGVK